MNYSIIDIKRFILYVFILILIQYAPCQASDLIQDNYPSEFHILDEELEDEFEWLHAETLVFSVNKYPEKLFQIPAAVYKINSEDMLRSGALTIPDILRYSPGINVAQFNTSDWSVAVRGFTKELVNNLLVLMDGRTLYTPIFSGVFWNYVDTIIEDIDSIEIIRGPGGTIWGANAVNGVINIISKKVQDTQGMLVSYNASSNHVETNLRYGGSLDSNRYYKIWMKAFKKEKHVGSASGFADQYNWQSVRGGFRFDWDHSDTIISLEASLVEENIMEDLIIYYHDARFRESYVMSKIEKKFENNSSMQLTAYFDHMVRNTLLYEVEKEDRCDIDFQHIYYINPYNRLTWGVGYRYISDRVNPDRIFTFDRLSWSRSITSGFIQHKWSLVPDSFIITMGSKLEYNEFTGFEKQPGIKMLWLPINGHAVWASISKAVRTPARIDLNANMITPLSWKKGNPDLDSEEMTAYEFGYRTEAIKNVQIDISAYYNVYDKLRRMASEDGFVIIPDNQMNAETYGFEFVLNWDVIKNTRYLNKWTLTNSWSFIRLNLHQLDNKSSTTEKNDEGNCPRNMVTCFSKMDITDWLQFDTSIKYVEALSTYEIPTYVKADVRLNYKLSENIQCQFIGQNILDPVHPEFLTYELKRLMIAKFVYQY